MTCSFFIFSYILSLPDDSSGQGTSDSTSCDIPFGYEPKSDGKFYRVVQSKTRFHEAERHCTSDGARLAMFKTEEEFNITLELRGDFHIEHWHHYINPNKLKSFSPGQSNRSTWIGLFNPRHHSETGVPDVGTLNGILSWHDGSDFLVSGTWFPRVEIEDGHYCIFMRVNGNVKSEVCSHRAGYICQFDCNDIAREFGDR